MTVTGAKPTTQISATCTRTVGDSLKIVGLSDYFDDDLGSLRLIPGQTDASGTITPDWSSLNPGSTNKVHLVAVYDTAIEIIGTWTETMANCSGAFAHSHNCPSLDRGGQFHILPHPIIPI